MHKVLDTSIVATFGRLEFYDKTNKYRQVNVTGVGANAEKTLDRLEFENNDSDSMYRLAGFIADTVTGSNVSIITIGTGDASVTQESFAFLDDTRKELDDFVFFIDSDSSEKGNQPLNLHQYDDFESGTITIGADASGCVGTATDAIVFRAFDYGEYKASDGSIKYGYQDDGQTVSDVGGPNILADTIYCQA